MRQIAILSGKGGTGKTSITSAFISLVKDGVFADCDVDASDLFLILTPTIKEEHLFLGGNTAIIHQENCTGCNQCYEVCNFNAVKTTDKKYSINQYACEGCNYCVLVCPRKAIELKQNNAGYWYLSDTRFGKMVHAKLFPGEENSGKLVTMVRHQARLLAEEGKKDTIIIDGPPGIGCPVISTLSGVDNVVVVTEPTKSGLSDLKRIALTAEHFRIPISVIINKYTLNKDMAKQIEKYCKEKKYTILGRLAFDKIFTEAMIEKKSVIEMNPKADISQKLVEIAKKINLNIKEEYL